MGLYAKEERKPFPLTDREVIARCLLGAADYYERTRNGAFRVDECVACVMRRFRAVYCEARGCTWQAVATEEEELAEMEQVYRRVEGTLCEEARRKAMAMASTLKARQIGKVAAEAAIRAAFSAAGMTPHIETQCYRAKVTVDAVGRGTAMIIIPYKVISKGGLDRCVGEFRQLLSALEACSCEVYVTKK